MTDLNFQIRQILSPCINSASIYMTWKFERHFRKRNDDRSVSVSVSRNRKFLGKWNSLRVLSRAHFHISVIYSVESKSSGEVSWQRPQGPGIPTAHGIRLFLYSRVSLARNGYLLYPLFTLTLSISACLHLFPSTVPRFSRSFVLSV